MYCWLPVFFKRCVRFHDESKKRYMDEREALAAAHRDWLAASKFFDFATDPDLVDYAVHSLKAAEKMYVYLWKMARQKGFSEVGKS